MFAPVNEMLPGSALLSFMKVIFQLISKIILEK